MSALNRLPTACTKFTRPVRFSDAVWDVVGNIACSAVITFCPDKTTFCSAEVPLEVLEVLVGFSRLPSEAREFTKALSCVLVVPLLVLCRLVCKVWSELSRPTMPVVLLLLGLTRAAILATEVRNAVMSGVVVLLVLLDDVEGLTMVPMVFSALRRLVRSGALVETVVVPRACSTLVNPASGLLAEDRPPNRLARSSTPVVVVVPVVDVDVVVGAASTIARAA